MLNVFICSETDIHLDYILNVNQVIKIDEHGLWAVFPGGGKCPVDVKYLSAIKEKLPL